MRRYDAQRRLAAEIAGRGSVARARAAGPLTRSRSVKGKRRKQADRGSVLPDRRARAPVVRSLPGGLRRPQRCVLLLRRARGLHAHFGAAAFGQDLLARDPLGPRRSRRGGLHLDQARRARRHGLPAGRPGAGASSSTRAPPSRSLEAPIRCAGHRSSAARTSRRRSPWRTPWPQRRVRVRR